MVARRRRDDSDDDDDDFYSGSGGAEEQKRLLVREQDENIGMLAQSVSRVQDMAIRVNEEITSMLTLKYYRLPCIRRKVLVVPE